MEIPVDASVIEEACGDPLRIGYLIGRYAARVDTTVAKMAGELGGENFQLLCLHPIPPPSQRRNWAISFAQLYGADAELLLDIFHQDGCPPEQTLGQRVKILRERKGWSQAEMARRIGPKAKENSLKSTLGKIERGELSNPSIETFAAIAEALDVSLDTLQYGPVPN